MKQKWKEDPELHSCKRVWDSTTTIARKDLDYDTIYKDEFLESDPLRDWESIDRCIDLWEWAIKLSGADPKDFCVLDCGTKDGQFPEWLTRRTKGAIGIEYSDEYVKYARDKGRPVVKGDVCDLQLDDYTYDFVFSHHLLGLTSNYLLGLEEMWRVTKPGGYMLTLNDVPGNIKKHYSFIDSAKIFEDFIESKDDIESIFWNGKWTKVSPKEYVLFIRKSNE